MNVLASYLQGCSGAVVEHLVHNLKVRSLRPPCAQLLFRYIPIPMTHKTQQKIQAHMAKIFFALCTK
jgi:hypothetical protein